MRSFVATQGGLYKSAGGQSIATMKAVFAAKAARSGAHRGHYHRSRHHISPQKIVIIDPAIQAACRLTWLSRMSVPT